VKVSDSEDLQHPPTLYPLNYEAGRAAALSEHYGEKRGIVFMLGTE